MHIVAIHKPTDSSGLNVSWAMRSRGDAPRVLGACPWLLYFAPLALRREVPGRHSFIATMRAFGAAMRSPRATLLHRYHAHRWRATREVPRPNSFLASMRVAIARDQ